jgi:hypothetical protein
MAQTRRGLLLGLFAAGIGARGQSAEGTVRITDAEKEEFLRKAKVVRAASVSRGITGTLRANLSNGKLTHEASIQKINEFKTTYQTVQGTEFNFKDSWQFDVAGYKLDRLLGLRMTPVSVPRKYGGSSSCFTWWVDDVLMLELDRFNRKVEPPDVNAWNQQLEVVRVFDQLIYNTDRNLGNLVIDKKWRVWMIDHTRAFRTSHDLREPRNLTRCDRALLQAMRGLSKQQLTKELGNYLSGAEIDGLLARRDKIVRLFEEKGDAVLFDMPRRNE